MKWSTNPIQLTISYPQYAVNKFHQQADVKYDAATAMDTHGYDDGESFDSLNMANDNLSIDQEFDDNQSNQSDFGMATMKI